MVPRNSSRAVCASGEENVAADSQKQQHTRPRLARSPRRRCRQRTSAWQREDQSRTFQVYRFRSRAPSISVHCSGRGSGGLSQIPALPGDGNPLEMLARSASYWVHQEPPRCWVRDCTCSAARPPPTMCLLQNHLQGEEEILTSFMREELLSMDEANDGSTGDSGTASSRADVGSDDSRRSFAEEYSLVPLSRRKRYSAQSFDRQVEEYFRLL